MSTTSSISLPVREALRLPKTAAVEAFAHQLSRRTTLPPEVAGVVARSVVNPQAARHELDRMKVRRLASGDGAVVGFESDVWTPTVIPFLANPRFFGLRSYLVANPLLEIDPPILPEADQDGHPIIHFKTASAERVRDALIAERDRLINDSKWRDSVREIGVRKAVDLMLVRVSHRDGRPPVLALASVDGSSRVLLCQEALGVEPEDVLYRLAGDVRRLHTVMGRVVQFQDTPLDKLSPEDQAAFRTLVIPAFIIVGVVSAQGRHLTALDAADDLLEDAHVDPPVPWPESGRLDQVANRVLRVLRDDGVIDPETWAWFMGHGPAPHGEGPEVRAAQLTHLLLSQRHHELISSRFREGTGKRMKSERKGEMIADLAMRAFDPRPGHERTAAGYRSAYSRALLLPGLDQEDRWEVTGRDPDELLNQALEELHGNRNHGPSALELGVIALYSLVRAGALTRELKTQLQGARSDGAAVNDNRAPQQVLAGLLESEHGLRQLHRAALDGRDGLKRIRAVDADGRITPVISADGLRTTEDRTLTSAALRALSSQARMSPPEAELPALAKDARQQFRDAFHQLRGAIEELPGLVSAAEAIDMSDGELAWRAVGVPKPWVDQLKNTLAKVAFRLEMWGEAFVSENPLPPEADPFSLDLGEDDISLNEPEASIAPLRFETQKISKSEVQVRSEAIRPWYATVRDAGNRAGHLIDIFNGEDGTPVVQARTQPGVRRGDAADLAGYLLQQYGAGAELPRRAKALLQRAEPTLLAELGRPGNANGHRGV